MSRVVTFQVKQEGSQGCQVFSQIEVNIQVQEDTRFMERLVGLSWYAFVLMKLCLFFGRLFGLYYLILSRL